MQLVSEPGIDLESFRRRLQPVEKILRSLARRDFIIIPMDHQNREFDNPCSKNFRRSPHRLQIHPNRNESVKKIEVFQGIEMRLVMRQFLAIDTGRKSKARNLSDLAPLATIAFHWEARGDS